METKKKCNNCNKDIDSWVRLCPFCGHDERFFSEKHPLMAIIFSLILISIFGLIINRMITTGTTIIPTGNYESKQSNIYDVNSNAYKMALLDNNGFLSSDINSADYQLYKKFDYLLKSVSKGFKTQEIDIANMTVKAKQRFKEKKNQDIKLITLLEGANSLVEKGAAITTYAEYMAGLIVIKD